MDSIVTWYTEAQAESDTRTRANTVTMSKLTLQKREVVKEHGSKFQFTFEHRRFVERKIIQFLLPVLLAKCESDGKQTISQNDVRDIFGPKEGTCATGEDKL